jgi:hypothetical protein
LQRPDRRRRSPYTLNRGDERYVVFGFAKPEDAKTFAERFGGERLAAGVAGPVRLAIARMPGTPRRSCYPT